MRQALLHCPLLDLLAAGRHVLDASNGGVLWQVAKDIQNHNGVRAHGGHWYLRPPPFVPFYKLPSGAVASVCGS